MTTKTKTKKAVPEPKFLKAIPMSFTFSIETVMRPPPTSVTVCPRCEKPHKKLKPRPFTRPMKFYSPVPVAPAPATPPVETKSRKSKSKAAPPAPSVTVPAPPQQVQTAQCSFWMMCPTTKEPIILFDQYDRSVEDMMASSMAKDMAAQIDRQVLSGLRDSPEPTQSKITISEPMVWTLNMAGTESGKKGGKAKK